MLRNSLTGLLHRIYMDTQPKDVPLLLPALLSYGAELSTLQGTQLRYPRHYLLSAFAKFLRHAKVRESEHSMLWRDLFLSFAHQTAC